MYIIFPKFHIKLFLFLLCVFFTFTQCKKDETSSTSDGIVIAKEVKVVSNETWNNQFISLDSSNYTITFSKDITSTQQIRSGDIIVSSAGEGLLRKVKSVSTTNNEIKVQTEPVSLTEVVQQGSIEFEKPLSMTQVSSIDYYYKGVKISSENIKGNTQTQFDWNINTVLYDDDSNPQTTNDQIKLVGKFSCDWKLKAKIIIGLKEGLKEVNFGFESGEDLNLQLIAGMQYKFEKEAKLATIRFTPITVFVGVVPVVFTPQLNIYAGIDGSAKASITTGINQSMSFNAGISYFKDQGWSPYKTFEKDINFQPPQINMNASAGIYLKPEILLKIYSIAGP
ncbi:MAG TPA: hypothetical protein VJ963_10180, partial [Bacteroidales bacterium]|nr:hypothetical protein [Bacteroidales bacterium]